MQARPLTYFYHFYWLLLLALFYSCAQIVSPGGGAKDITAPSVEKFIPDSAATNFKAKSIAIYFDEYIQLVDLQKELTISPPMHHQPDIKAKGRMLQIEITDTLKTNTTYVLNFGNSIRDFTEGNIKKDFQYIFSTGNIIDTLKLSGGIKYATDLKTEKGILVILFNDKTDSVPYKIGPFYFARTNPDGSYQISHIKPGLYKAFALKDENGNSRFDIPTESVGFSDTLVKISRNQKLDFTLFKEETKKQLLLKHYVRGYASIVLLFSKPVKSLSYEALNPGTKTQTFLTEYNLTRDSIRIWTPEFTNDSLHFKIIVEGEIIDTLKIGTTQFQKDNGGRGEAFKLVGTMNAAKTKPLDINKSLELTFSYPIKEYKPENIFLTNGKQKITSTNKNHKDSLGRKFSFDFDLIQDSLYRLEIVPGTFIDIFGLTNDTLKTEFKLQEERFYGTLKMILKMKKTPIKCIVQLVNDKGSVSKEDILYESKELFYPYLSPGKYRIKIIYDTNEDGKWTTGNYLLHKQPEKISFFAGEINIRANWDLELDWDLTPPQTPVVKQEGVKQDK